MERFGLSEIQARAIVEMRLRQLTGLLQDQLHAEYEEIKRQIAYYESILSDDEMCRKVIKDELIEVKEKYGDERRSEIVYASEEFNPEDFYADDEMVITISHWGISSVHLSLNSGLRTVEEWERRAVTRVIPTSWRTSIRQRCIIRCCSSPKGKMLLAQGL